MKNLIPIISLLLVSISSCCKTEDNNIGVCAQKIVTDSNFIAKYNCIYTYVLNEDTTVQIEFVEIDDLRTFGSGCSVSTGGNAHLFFKLKLLNREETKYVDFNWNGCDGDQEYEITNPSLPSFQFGSFQFKMMKLFPLSKSVDVKPKNIEDYEIKLVILNQ